MAQLESALEAVFEDHPGTKKDRALRELALMYARALDYEEIDLDKGGPRLIQALDHLLLTPKSRQAARQAKDDSDADAGPNPLDQLRHKRAARVNNA